jgi:hypothetical protein
LLKDIFPDVEGARSQALNVILRTWIAKFDVEEGNRKLAEE